MQYVRCSGEVTLNRLPAVASKRFGVIVRLGHSLAGVGDMGISTLWILALGCQAVSSTSTSEPWREGQFYYLEVKLN